MNCTTFYTLGLNCELCYILQFMTNLWVVVHITNYDYLVNCATFTLYDWLVICTTILHFMVNLCIVLHFSLHVGLVNCATFYTLWLTCEMFYKIDQDILWKELTRHTLLPTSLNSCCQSKPQPALHLITPPPLFSK